MRRPATALVLVCTAALAACGGGGDDQDAATPADAVPLRELTAGEQQSPAPSTAGALVQVPDAQATRGRIGYVNTARLGELDGALGEQAVLRRVLDTGARRLTATTTESATAVQVAGATIVDDGSERRVIGAPDGLAKTLATRTPTVNAIQAQAQSAAQSCLGDTIAQTLVGPAVMGNDAAVGVGLRAGGDAPAGLKLAICWAPHLVRDLHGAEKRLKTRFAETDAIIEEVEIGERETLSAVVPAAALDADELLALLGAGPEVRRLVAG